MLRVLLHEVAHLCDGSPVPYRVEEWYGVEVRANRAVLPLARQLDVEDSLLPDILACERRALKTKRRWLVAAGQAMGSLRLPIAESVLQLARTMSSLVGDSERTGLAKLYLRPGYRAWLLDLPRSALRSFWAFGEPDPLAALVQGYDVTQQDDAFETDAEADWTSDEGISNDAADRENALTRIEVSSNDLWDPVDDQAWEDMEKHLWAIPPDHPIFGRGDDRDDGELSAQRHASPMFHFGHAWNDLISERRRASLLAFVSRRLASLPAQPTWTLLIQDSEALAAAYVLVASTDDLVRACSYLQSALLDQHIDATATAVWILYTTGIDPTCDFSWYRLRMTFTGNLFHGWPPIAEVWIAMDDDYPGFLVAGLQSYMAGWSQEAILCPVFADVAVRTPPSTLLAQDTRLSSGMRATLSRWLDEQHSNALDATSLEAE